MDKKIELVGYMNLVLGLQDERTREGKCKKLTLWKNGSKDKDGNGETKVKITVEVIE